MIRVARRSMRAGGASAMRLSAASASVGLLSSVQKSEGARPRRFPDELLSESTRSAVSMVTVSCLGHPSSATPRGGPPSLRETAPLGQMRMGEDGSAAAASRLPAYHPRARRTSISAATALAPPSTW
eukprot:6180482-Pleurochrysis_carterae.AAC.3